jgi:hypothetical protein
VREREAQEREPIEAIKHRSTGTTRYRVREGKETTGRAGQQVLTLYSEPSSTYETNGVCEMIAEPVNGSAPTRLFKEGDSMFIFNTQRSAAVTSARIMCSLFCSLNLLIHCYAFGAGFRLPTASARSEARNNVDYDRARASALQGAQAVSWLKQQGIYDSLRPATEASRYQLQWADGAYQAINPAQNLRARFTPTEMSLAAGDKGRDQQLGMKLTAIGYGANLHHLAEGEMMAAGNRIEYLRKRADGQGGKLVEWYLNRAEGLEQGFTIAERPEDNPSGARLTVALETTGNLAAKLQADRRGLVLESEDGTSALSYSGLHAYDARGEEMASELVLADNAVHLEVDDSEAIYPLTIDPVFAQVTKLSAADGAADDEFSYSVSISGDTAVVGALNNDIGGNQDQGAAYVFERNQGGANTWGQVVKLIASDGAYGDQFGNAVAIDGDTIAVGARLHNVGGNIFQGSAYIFARNQGGANQWGEVKEITASDGTEEDAFGGSIAISGDTIAVGAGGKNKLQGSAYVFERNQGGTNNWGEIKKLTASDGTTDDRFGTSIALNLDTIVVGAPLHQVGAEPQQGSAYVFERNQGGAGQWGEIKKLSASDGVKDDFFGDSVGIAGDTIVVGADFDDVGAKKDQGSAYVFERNQGGAGQWGEIKKLSSSDGAEFDYFGTSVAISLDTIVVGVPGDDVGANSAQGSAYVFERNQGGANTWGEIKKLTASDGETNDELGVQIAISGATIIAGAYFDVVGANQAQGSSYIFAFAATNLPPQINPATLSRQQGSPAAVEAIATVSDDLNAAGSLVVTVTSAPAGISVSSITNTNGTITASIAVACSATLGTNLVGLQVTDANNATATGNLTINVTAETTPPTIACPTGVTAIAARPGDATVVVNYPPPMATDNCSVPTVACNPPSGSAFPVGTTTVICTATDAASNTAQCSFSVTVFDVCLQDDSDSGRVLLFNSLTGDYVFCCSGLKYTGKGSVTKKGGTFTLIHYVVDRRLQASVDATVNRGTASLQMPPGSLLCSITDRDIRNNTCGCSAP